MSLTAHRDGDAVVVTLEEEGVVVTLELDLAPHDSRIGALTNALVKRGLLRKAVVLSTSDAAGHRTPFEDLEHHEQQLVGVFVRVGWCRPEPVVAGTDERRTPSRVQEVGHRRLRDHPKFAPMHYSTCGAFWAISGDVRISTRSRARPDRRSPAAVWGTLGGAPPDSEGARAARRSLAPDQITFRRLVLCGVEAPITNGYT